MGDTIEGVVASGINSIYVVWSSGSTLICTIKGKRLIQNDGYHTPLAAGDRVRVVCDDHSRERGVIISRLDRTQRLVRWSRKRRAPQLIAANAEALLCVCSLRNPPFRPRFLDRLIVAGEAGGLQPVVVANKTDLEEAQAVLERLAEYERLGYEVIRCSAHSGTGIGLVVDRLRASRCVLAGQSGVGKSTILNVIDPGLELPVAPISAKYDRGVHTTNYSRMVRLRGDIVAIDTPGVREFDVYGIDPEHLWESYPELVEIARDCTYPGCLHREEDGCAVERAIAEGRMHPDRYEGYLRLFADLVDLKRMGHE